MNTPKISIIIPAYNLKDYIGRCLDSVLAQTFKDFEVIVINDGSTDATIQICNSYRKKDSRIIIINQENRGLGYARNQGLNNSKGEFIAFLDGDDAVHPQYLEILYSKAIEYEADITVCNYIKGHNDNIMLLRSYNFHNLFTKLIDKKALLHKMYNEHPFITVWAKIYRKNIIKSGLVPRGIGEDVELNSRIYIRANNVVYIDIPLYFWRQRNQSLSNSSFNYSNINKIKNYFYTWVNLRNNKYYSNYAIKKLYKIFLSSIYEAPDDYKLTVEKKIKYYKNLSIKYLYSDVSILHSLCINFMLGCPIIYKLFRKSIEKMIKIRRKLIPVTK